MSFLILFLKFFLFFSTKFYILSLFIHILENPFIAVFLVLKSCKKGMPMNNFLVNKSIDFIKIHSESDSLDIDKIKYGIEGLYLTISKIIIVFLISIIFNYFDIVLFTIIFFNVLRFFGFGLHAKKSIECLIISIFNFNILPIILMNININDFTYFIIYLVIIISYILFAPSDTEKRPLTNKRKRIIRKIGIIICSLLLVAISFKYEYFKVPITCSLIIEFLMINPLSYYALNLKYNNYKKI